MGTVQIESGYRPGLIGEIASLHAIYYSQNHGFGPEFEIRVASDLCEFVPRLGNKPNEIWHVSKDGRLAGSIAIDGEDLGNGSAHLRWFILNDRVRGSGVGQQLLTNALAFCDRLEIGKCVLWTFSGLDAARHLYEKHGFSLVEEWRGDQWGRLVSEQRFERLHSK